MIDSRIQRVLGAYAGFASPRELRPVAVGQGFSGANVWRVEVLAGSFALRAWHPQHPTPPRLSWIHAVLAHVSRKSRETGLAIPIPVPLTTLTGPTWVEWDGRCWELAPWLPGAADEQSPPRRERQEAAARMLACFHRAAADFSAPCPGWEALGRYNDSPGIGERRQQLARWMSDDWASLEAAIRNGATDWQSFDKLAARWLTLARRVAPRVASQLAAVHHQKTPLQPCLRDIKRDHVLFTDDVVTGIVDFGAVRPESVAADLARLIGSYAAESAQTWHTATAAYETLRPLSAYERWLIGVFHDSGLLLGGGNWVEWVMVQQQVFQDRGAVEARLCEILERLAAVAERR